MQALDARLAQMEQAFNTNTKVFSDGVQMLEAQNAVLRHVSQDLFNELRFGIKNHIPLAANNAIDFNAYLKEYIEELVEREAKKEEGASKARILLDSSDTDSPIIFGE